MPLRYFDRRPVGELSSRINELENIRQFLTGTALTVVLDAVFSVVYIRGPCLPFTRWLLTLVALATIPFFVILTLFVAPIVRRQLRVKARKERPLPRPCWWSRCRVFKPFKAQNI